MEREIILSGVGGQGIQVNGQLLAHAAAQEGKDALYYALFGGAQKGGVSDCIVVISDSGVTAAPLTLQPISAAICMHPNSLKKFEEWVKPGGLMVFDRSVTATDLVYQMESGAQGSLDAAKGARKPLDIERTDIGLVSLPASKIAYEELGNSLVATLITIGVFVEYTQLLKMDVVKESLKKAIRPGRHKFLPVSEKALERGAQAVRKGEVQWHNQAAVALWKAPQIAARA